MKVTFLGHAGLYVETEHGSILCDPWFNPAYFASWVPFPRNHELDLDARSRSPDYLYISHSTTTISTPSACATTSTRTRR